MNLNSIQIIPIHTDDAPYYYALYSDRAKACGDNCFLMNEQPLEFLKRIYSYCDRLYVIKSKDIPHIVLGDIALHHYNPEENSIQFGGTILFRYWGKGIMREAFNQLKEVLKTDYKVNKIIGVTTPENTNAIRLVEKLGFTCTGKAKKELIYEVAL